MFGKKKEKPVEAPKKKDEDWMTKKWRPLMAMMYMFCCLCDFALFPVMFTVVQFWETQAANDAFRQWVPITLQGGGLFHVAMGAVLGITAWSRGQEKIAGVASQPQPATVTTTTQQIQYAPSQPAYQEPRFQQPQVATGFGGKPAPQQHFPEI